jgi:hypothetical protein
MLADLRVSSSWTIATILIIVIIVLLVGVFGTLIALYFTNDKAHDRLSAFFTKLKHTLSVFSANQKTAREERARQRTVRDIIHFVDEPTLNAIMANVSVALSGRGFILQAQQPGLYTYAKTERPSILIAIFLWLLCFIPGIIYLVAGGGVSTATVRISQVQQGYHFSATGPAKTVVRRTIMPYTIQL